MSRSNVVFFGAAPLAAMSFRGGTTAAQAPAGPAGSLRPFTPHDVAVWL